MRPIEAGELLDLAAYERVRKAYRRRIIELKKPRRIAIGDRLCFVFENRDTVLFQIQEMLRAERIVDAAAIQAEVDVYNELIPGAHELSATLLIEIPESKRIRSELDRLIGIDAHVALQIGATRTPARFDPKQREADRISAVQYLRFPLGPEGARRFRDRSQPAALHVTHPRYRARAPIEGASRESLAHDLDPDDGG
ncbi:MAG: DUF3501 family protein [Myxococcota bacterium]